MIFYVFLFRVYIDLAEKLKKGNAKYRRLQVYPHEKYFSNPQQDKRED